MSATISLQHSAGAGRAAIWGELPTLRPRAAAAVAGMAGSQGAFIRATTSVVLPVNDSSARYLPASTHLGDFLAELEVLRGQVLSTGTPLLDAEQIDQRIADMRGTTFG